MRRLYPPAPEIGGDAYEVADWLRKCLNVAHPDDAPTVLVLLAEFEWANPETRDPRIGTSDCPCLDGSCTACRAAEAGYRR